MSFEVDQLVDRILTGVSRGNDAYCLIYAGQNQKLQFIMRKCKFEIIKLWVSSPEGFWDEKSFSGILFSRKEHPKKERLRLSEQMKSSSLSNHHLI